MKRFKITGLIDGLGPFLRVCWILQKLKIENVILQLHIPTLLLTNNLSGRVWNVSPLSQKSNEWLEDFQTFVSLCDSFIASGIPSRQRATHCIYIRQRFYPLLRTLWASQKCQAWWMNTVWRRYPRCLLSSSCWQYPFWPPSQWLLYWDLANCVWGVVKAPQTGFQFNFCATSSGATWCWWSKTSRVSLCANQKDPKLQKM